jgi:serine/threonine protein kinase
LTLDGTVKILDLGLARLHGDSGPGAELTDTGQTMGTADYIAPEQVLGARDADIRADIYSLGCTFYKLLAGQAPYTGPQYASTGAKLVAHVHDPIPPLAELRPDVPAAVLAIVARMTAKSPDHRYATPGELVEALDQWLNALSPAHATDTFSPASWPRRYPIVRQLARGTHCTVYLVQHPRQGLCVLKAAEAGILFNPAVDLEIRVRMEREAYVMAALSQLRGQKDLPPDLQVKICPMILDVSPMDAGGDRYMIQEYLSRGSLQDKLKENTDGMSPDRVLAIARRVAAQLAALEELGITHRDLKPGNILEDDDGEPLLIDFGLARVAPVDSGSASPAANTFSETLLRRLGQTGKGAVATSADSAAQEFSGPPKQGRLLTMSASGEATGVVSGTIGFAAPEQLRSLDAADSRSDVYALGATIFTLLTGKPPYEDHTDLQEHRDHIAEHGLPPLPEEIRQKLKGHPLLALYERTRSSSQEERPTAKEYHALVEQEAQKYEKVPVWAGIRWTTRQQVCGALGIAATAGPAIAGWMKIAGNDDASPGRPDPSDPRTVAGLDPGGTGQPQPSYEEVRAKIEEEQRLEAEEKKAEEERLFNEKLDAVALDSDGSPYPILDEDGNFAGIGFKGMEFKVTLENSAWTTSEDGKTIAGVTRLGLAEIEQFNDIVTRQLALLGRQENFTKADLLERHNRPDVRKRLDTTWVFSPQRGSCFKLYNFCQGYHAPSEDRSFLYPFVSGVHTGESNPGLDNPEVLTSFAGTSNIRRIPLEQCPQDLRPKLDIILNSALPNFVSSIVAEQPRLSEYKKRD